MRDVEEHQQDFCLPTERSTYVCPAVPRQSGKRIGGALCFLGQNKMTVEIPLTKGYTTIVDDEDADLGKLKWRAHTPVETNHVYAKRNQWIDKKKKFLLLHRIIFSRILGRNLISSEGIDHIDGNGLNNCRENLRLATAAQNQQNVPMRSNNTSGFKGVSFDKRSGKYRANICFNKNHIYLGRFDTAELAYSAYCEAAKKYHGEFVRFE